MKPKFEPTRRGVEIIDPIERHRYHLETGSPVTPSAADTDRIGFPIGSAVTVTTDSITLPKPDTVLVRNSDGLMLTEVSPTEQLGLPPDEYTLDLSGPLKVYARVTGSVQVFSDREKTYLTFGTETAVHLGARSLHKRPARTITTTTAPTDLMAAVSAFGSELKTTSPERTYPTLRGHPPRLELGDELRIPAPLDRDHSVRIAVPETLRHVFVVAPLAYYLDAAVVPGSRPRIVTESGYTQSLDGSDGFEPAVKRALQRTFLLDCVVRTEGNTPLPSRERRSIEPVIDLDIADTYDRPLAERLERYLEIPYEKLEPHLPDWQFETRLEPTADHVPFLPFLADDLAIVTTRESDRDRAGPEPVAERAIDAFTRDDFVRSTQPSSVRGDARVETATDQSDAPTIQQSWTGIDETEIVSTTSVTAYRNDIGRTPKDGPIEIEVVCNDPDMREELESVNGTYGSRTRLPFETTIHYDLTTDDLAAVLAKDSDFLHYIGHIDDEGFQCSDGKLDAHTVDTVGIKAFLLNACRSHEQGLHLVERGSIGGIVTLSNVVNSGAVSVGVLVSRLLNLGFSLYSTLDIARQENIVGQQYQLVGDGRTTITQSETRIPNVCLVSGERDTLTANIVAYTAANRRHGSVLSPHIDSVESYFVVPGETGPIPVTESELEALFDEALFPVIRDGHVQWSTDLVDD
ncbi:hypothetical protein Natpe_3615 [Natrinema pellirubrum DSM 15624]|uniref:CHAT domain-containing protein n=1 Tax=Natrinema pellirubrum (strain DSM 15624 / CIP 106293 / JCM 10476 / NCIMB 786 / 157) TaxID=797303 RepID=L0JRZ0_NATP1|nr:hypothetical protein [Natrinema pellirubrum]AGB33382.1 hypothetical protein Natpe_3615 [Natrinema pellirubrum DSM 15624]